MSRLGIWIDSNKQIHKQYFIQLRVWGGWVGKNKLIWLNSVRDFIPHLNEDRLMIVLCELIWIR